MIEITAVVSDMTQKYKTDKEGARHVHLSMKLEVKDGVKRVADIAKHLNKAVTITIEELQPGFINEDKE